MKQAGLKNDFIASSFHLYTKNPLKSAKIFSNNAA